MEGKKVKKVKIDEKIKRKDIRKTKSLAKIVENKFQVKNIEKFYEENIEGKY